MTSILETVRKTNLAFSTTGVAKKSLLQVTFLADGTAEMAVLTEKGSIFRVQQPYEAFYGQAKLENQQHVLPAWMAGHLIEAGTEFHSDHGVFVGIDTACFFPPAWKTGQLAVHLQPPAPSAGGGWTWRLVASTPSQTTLPFNASGLINQLEAVIGGTAQFSKPQEIEASNIPQWLGKDAAPERLGNASKQTVLLELPGTVITLALGATASRSTTSPLRLKADWLKSTYQDGDWIIELIEGKPVEFFDQHPHPHGARICENPNGHYIEPIGAWVVPVAPIDATAAQAAAAGETAGNKMALWAHGTASDEWLRLPIPASARVTTAGESRRWQIGELLRGFADSMRAALWLDNCGGKILRISIGPRDEDASIVVREMQLFIERLYLEMQLDENFWLDPAASLFVPAESAAALNLTQTPRVTLMSQPADLRGSLQVKIGAAGCELQRRAGGPPATYWLRHPAGLLGPADWAQADPRAATAVSRLRGLVPTECKDWTLRLPAAGANPAELSPVAFSTNEPAWPEFALGRRLLVASPDDGATFLEIEVGAGASPVRLRHASPHLDAHYATSRPILSGHATGSKDQQARDQVDLWSQVADRYHPAPDATDGVRGRLSLSDLTPAALVKLAAVPVAPAGTAFSSRQPARADLWDMVRALWYPDWKRWALVPARPLRLALGAGLRLLPLGLELNKDGTAVRSAEFMVAPAASDDALPQPLRQAAMKLQSLSMDGNQYTLSGTLALSASWLSGQHATATSIEWVNRTGLKEGEEIKDGSPTVEFLGLEAGSVEWQTQQLRLLNVRYWFYLDGSPFSVNTRDTLVIVGGKWSYAGEAAMSIATDPATSKATAKFAHVQHIAPGVELKEFLLDDRSQALLTLKYGGRTLDITVLTSYEAMRGAGAGANPVAVLRGATYHLAWAKPLGDPTAASSTVAYLTLGALTRAFLEVTRNQTGQLEAKGMLGWRCPGLEVDKLPFTSREGRATLYARKPGAWSRLRLSGVWTRDATSVGDPQALSVVMPRNDFPVDSAAWPLSICLPNESVAPEVALVCIQFKTKGVGQKSAQAICFQAMAAPLGMPSTRGDVRARVVNQEWSKKSALRSTAQLGTARLVAYSSRELRDQLVSTDPPWHAIALIPSGTLLPDLMAAASKTEISRGTKRLTPAGSGTLAGLTRIQDTDEWLLCPVEQMDESPPMDRRPKLWLLNTDGEDLVELSGFGEKLGAAATASAPDRAKLQRSAEQLLSFMRWRKPAVLEYWSGDAVTWEIVDAPLLNPFSSLAFMDSAGRRAVVSRQPQPGWVHMQSLPVIAENGLAITPLDDAGMRVNMGARLGTSRLLLGREIHFEQGSGFDPQDQIDDAESEWIADSAAWPPPGTKEGQSGDTWESLTSRTAWTMATPRPGERVLITAEAVWGAEDSDQFISPVQAISSRSPAGQNEPSAAGVRIEDGAVQWPMGPEIVPQESIDAATAPDILLMIGGPSGQAVKVNQPFVVAVSSPVGTTMSVVLLVALKKEFRLSVPGVGQVTSGSNAQGHNAFLVLPPMAHNRLSLSLQIESKDAPAAGDDAKIYALVELLDGEPGQARLESTHNTWSDARAKVVCAIEAARSARSALDRPSLVACLGEDRKVLAYGPAEARYRLSAHEGGFRWQAWGEWRPEDPALAKRVRTVLLIRSDGGVQTFS